MGSFRNFPCPPFFLFYGKLKTDKNNDIKNNRHELGVFKSFHKHITFCNENEFIIRIDI